MNEDGGSHGAELMVAFSGEALLDGDWEALGLDDERDRAVGLHHALASLRSTLAAVVLRLGDRVAHFAPAGRFGFEPMGAARRDAPRASPSHRRSRESSSISRARWRRCH